MNTKLQKHKEKLLYNYKVLIEEAYNLRENNDEMSDISEYHAMIMLNRLNRLKYLDRDLQTHS